MADVQAFYTQITLDGSRVEAYCNDVQMPRNINVMEKPTMDGSGVPLLLAGQRTGSVSLSGQVDTVGQAIFEAEFDAAVPVTLVVEVGDGATIDAGTYTGTVIVNSLPVEAAADDTWNFSLDATGFMVYTAPA